MEFWFSELHSPHVKFDIRVEKQLFSGKSDYQRIDVFESPEFGKFLTLNGSVIFSHVCRCVQGVFPGDLNRS